jgi:hypothetical protein
MPLCGSKYGDYFCCYTLKYYDLISIIVLHEFSVCVLQHTKFRVLVSGKEVGLLCIYFLLSFSKMQLEGDLRWAPLTRRILRKNTIKMFMVLHISF